MYVPTVHQRIIALFILFHAFALNWHNLFNLTIFVYGCPTRLLTKPCSCNEITKGLEIVCEGVQMDKLRNVFTNLQKTGETIMYLKMNNNHMPTFPSMLLNGLNVRHLMAHKCNMIQVEDSAFAGIQDKIESIDFSLNKFTEIPNALKGLSSLVSLNLNYNQIISIHENAFEGLTSLLRLSLYGNKISSIHPQAFVGVGINLTRINLGGNMLSSVPNEALRILQSVQRFQIHENQINTLNRRDFANLELSDNLDALNLAHNSLTQIEANVFCELKTLNSIDLESNQISIIDDDAFSGIEDKLEWLKLGENQLKVIPTGALQNLTNLRELDLRGNQIHTIGKESFLNFGTNIKFLYLQKNKIENIENAAFDKMHSIEWLHLNSNNLKHIPKHLFAKLLNTLLILDLHDNPLICGCELDWYRKWIEQNSKNQRINVWKETKCDIVLEQNKIREISIFDLQANNIKCAAISFVLYDKFIYLLVMISIVMI